MKAQLTFDLDDPGDHDRFLRCVNAEDVDEAVHEFTTWLRGQIKYGGENDADEHLTKAWNKLFAVFNERGLSPWGEE